MQNVDFGETEIQGLPGPADKSIVAAGHCVPAKRNEIESLTEGDRHHGEIDAAQANDQRADKRANKDAEARARDEIFQRHAGAIGAEAEIGGMAEGEHAGIAEQEVQRHRRKAENDDTRAEFGVAADRRQPERHAEEQQPDDGGCGAFLHIVAAHQKRPSSPKRPRGRTRSTAAIITYITASVADGKNTVVTPEATPISKPPSNVPGRLPRPPTMIATKLGMISEAPIVGCSPSWPTASTPARPAK